MQYNDEVGAVLICAFYSGAYRPLSSTTSTCYDRCSSCMPQRARVRLARCLAVFRLLACHPSIGLSRVRRYLPPSYHPAAASAARRTSHVGCPIPLRGSRNSSAAKPCRRRSRRHSNPSDPGATSQVARNLRALRPYAPSVLCLAEPEGYFPDVSHPTLIRKRSQASYPIGSLSTPDY